MGNEINILIVGSGAAVSVLAKKLSLCKNVGKIFAASSSNVETKYFQNVDIREDDLTGLLKFALENNIGLTIPIGEKSLMSDITSFFISNDQKIFAPVKEACNISFNKVAGKKFLYKIHAQTSKYGIFDRIQTAQDWLEGANFPVLIKSFSCKNNPDVLVCPTIKYAKMFLESLFSKGEENVLIEEYIIGHNFTVYYVTDGYSAVPIVPVGNYKFAQDGDSGAWTNGAGCFAPDYKISDILLSRLNNVVNNTLSKLEANGTPYVGILGVECVLTGEDKFYVNEYKSFLQDCDAAAVLNLVEDDILKIFMDCVDGLFSDEYSNISLNNLSSVSCVVSSRCSDRKIEGLDLIEDLKNIDFCSGVKYNQENEEHYSASGDCFVLTRTATTLNRAKTYLYDDLSEIGFNGMSYRKDICK